MTCDGGTFNIPINNSYYVQLTINSIIFYEPNPDFGATKQWKGEGLIKNINGTTSLVGSFPMTSTYGDSALSGTSVSVTADNAGSYLKINVSGETATDIHWFGVAFYNKASALL